LKLNLFGSVVHDFSSHLLFLSKKTLVLAELILPNEETNPHQKCHLDQDRLLAFLFLYLLFLYPSFSSQFWLSFLLEDFPEIGFKFLSSIFFFSNHLLPLSYSPILFSPFQFPNLSPFSLSLFLQSLFSSHPFFHFKFLASHRYFAFNQKERSSHLEIPLLLKAPLLWIPRLHQEGRGSQSPSVFIEHPPFFSIPEK